MQKCRSLVSKKVSISLLQGLGLGLVSDVKMNVSVSSRSRGNVGRSRSRSRLGLKIKRLGLVSVSHHKVSFTSLLYLNAIPSNPGERERCPMVAMTSLFGTKELNYMFAFPLAFPMGPAYCSCLLTDSLT